MPHVNKRACDDFGLDYKKVQSVARRIEKAAKEADEMGLTVMGTGAGGGVLSLQGVPSRLERGAWLSQTSMVAVTTAAILTTSNTLITTDHTNCT